MQEKEVSELIGNFEVNKEENKVLIFINPRIFPVSVVNKTASFFKDDAWVSIDGDPREELLVEIKPKNEQDLELLAKKFNNKLLEYSTKDVKFDKENTALISKIKEVVKQFVSEEEGRITKQSIMTVGAILGSLGLANMVDASHLCNSGGGDGGGDCLGAAGDSPGGEAACFIIGTKILLDKNIEKSIEEIKPGDKLLGKNDINIVRKIITPKLGDRKLYGINEGEKFVTGAHPFLTKEGWKSIEPEETKKTHSNLVIGALKIGDKVLTGNGELKINSITSMDGDAAETVYNFYLSGDHTYRANGFIVHNKTCFIAGTKVGLKDGTIKNIEDVKVGERLIGTNNNANIVLKLDRTVLGQRKLISFNKGPFFITPEHPIMTKEGWKSLEPEISENENPDLKGKVGKLSIGDKLIAIPKIVEIDGKLMILEQEIVLSSIEEKPDRSSLILYNFILDGDHSFNADGFVVHNHTGCGQCAGGCSCGGGPGSGCFCFPARTKVVMADSSLKNIEDIKVNDSVLTYDFSTKQAMPAKVLELDTKIREGYYKLNGNLLRVTDDHPIYARKQDGTVGWAAINKKKSERAYSIKPASSLQIGDEIFTLKGWVKLSSLKYVKGPTRVYTIKDIEKYDAFFADNVVVLKSKAFAAELPAAEKKVMEVILEH